MTIDGETGGLIPVPIPRHYKQLHCETLVDVTVINIAEEYLMAAAAGQERGRGKIWVVEGIYIWG